MKTKSFTLIRNFVGIAPCLSAVLCFLPTPCTQAATLWFDGGTANITTNGDGISQTSSGNWNNTTTNWDQGSGLPHINWDNTNNAGSTAYFGGVFGATYTISVASGGINAGNIIIANPASGSGRCVISSGPITLGTVNSSAVIDESGSLSTGSTGGQISSALLGTLPGGLTLIGANSTYATNFNVANSTTPPRLNLLVMSASNAFAGPVTVSNIVEMQAISASSRWDMFGPAANNVTLANGTLFLYASGAVNPKTFDHNIAVVGSTNALNMNDATGSNLKSNSVSGTITGGSTATLWSAVPAGAVLAYSGDLSGYNGLFISRGTTTGTNLIDCPAAFGGTFYVESGVLQIGNNDTGGNLGSGNITNNGTINYNRTGSLTYPGNSSGSGQIIVNSGTLVLSGVNTYTGGTTVNQGTTLTINGAGQLASGVSITNNGAFDYSSTAGQTLPGISGTGNNTISAGILQINSSLGGSGAILGTVTVNSGGGFGVAGNGVLTLNSTLTLGAITADNTSLNFQGNGSTIPGMSVTTSGAFVNNGTATVNITGVLPSVANTTYTLINYSGSVSGAGSFVLGSLPPGLSGYVTNDTTVPAIELVVTAVDSLRWSGSPTNDWDLLGHNNWVLNSSGLPTSYQDGQAVTFNDSASSFVVNVAAAVSPGGVIVSNNVNNYTFGGSGGITGVTPLTKNGSGTLTIDTANNYSGQTTVNGGVLQLGDGSANNGSVSSGIADNAAVVFANPTNQTYAGAISGSGSVAKQSAGTLTISGNNTYDGATTISGGTVIAGSTNALGSTVGGTTVNPGGALDVNSQNLGAEAVSIAGTGPSTNGVIVNSGAAQTQALQSLALNNNATIGGLNRWDVRDAGSGASLNLNGLTLTKTGTNDIAMVGTVVSDGSVVINQGRFGFQLGASFPAGAGQIVVNPGGTLWIGDFGTALQISQPVVMNGGVIQADSGTSATLNSPVNLTTNTLITAAVPIYLTNPTNAVSGTGLLTVGGTSTLVLDSLANTWSGGLVINSNATVQLGNNDGNGAGALPSSVGVITNNGLLAYALTTDLNFSQSMVGIGGVEQAGAGNLTMTNRQNYAGETALARGTLTLAGGNNTLSNVTVLSFIGNGTLSMGTNSQTVSGLTIDNEFGSTIGNNSVSYVTGTGALNVIGANDLLLGPVNTYFDDVVGVDEIVSLNLAGLNSFSFNNPTNQFSVGGLITPQVDSQVTLVLALTNSITAGVFGAANNGGYPGYDSFGTVTLGNVNVINANTVEVGYASMGPSSGYVANGTLNYSGASNPTLKIRAADGVSRANMVIGYNANSSYAQGTGMVDLYDGVSGASTLDALVGSLVIGQHNYNAPSAAVFGAGTFIMGNGLLDVTNIVIGQQTDSGTHGYVTGTFTDDGGTVNVKTMVIGDNQQSTTLSIASEFDLNGGTLLATTIQAGGGGTAYVERTFNWNGGTIANYTNSNLSITGLTLSLNNGYGTPAFFIAAGQSGTVSGGVIGTGSGLGLNGGTSIAQTGAGTLILSGDNTGFSGTLTNLAGTLYVNGPISGSVEVLGGATLAGSNTLVTAQIDNGGTVQAGSAFAGVLTASTLNLGVNSTDMTYSQFNPGAGGMVSANSLNVNGTNIVNITGTLAVGTNNLISYSGSIGGSGFGGFKLGLLPAGTTGYLQNNSTVGSVQLVVTGTVNTAPATITTAVSGGMLTISWPSDHLGWRLEAQTNSLSTGLGTNWITWSGSTNVTSVAVPISPVAPTVFFRLVYP